MQELKGRDDWLVFFLHSAAHPTHALMDCPGRRFWEDQAAGLRIDDRYSPMIRAADRVAAGEVWPTENEQYNQQLAALDYGMTAAEAAVAPTGEGDNDGQGEPEGLPAPTPARAGRGGRRSA